MDAIREFRFRSFKWHWHVRFYPDRVESSWDDWGLGIQKGKRSVLKEKLQPILTESATFGFRARGSSIRVGQFLVVGAATWLFAPPAWRAWAWLPVVLAVLPLFVGLGRLRKGAWLNLQTRDGAVALALDVTDWKSEEVVAFREFFTVWMKEPNKAPAPTPPSVTIRAYARLAPAVVVAHL
jgi:hypothetical protein